MAEIIAVANQKGGVGKTTITFNLAKGLAKRKHKVLAIDNDPQGNLTTSMLKQANGTFIDLTADILDIFNKKEGNSTTVEPQKIMKNLDYIGATLRLAEVADKTSMDLPFMLREYLYGGEGAYEYVDDYDYIIIDCLPSFGPLNVSSLIAADHVLIPTKPAPYAIDGLVSLFNNVMKLKKRGFNRNLNIIGIILNLTEGTRIHKALEQVLRTQYEDLVFPKVINKGTTLEESPYYGESVMEYAPNSKQAAQLKVVIRELLKRMK